MRAHRMWTFVLAAGAVWFGVGPASAAGAGRSAAAADFNGVGPVAAVWSARAAMSVGIGTAPGKGSPPRSTVAGGRKQTVQVAMSDGVKLATAVYLPAGEGPFPVILSRTPYNKRRAVAAGFVLGGYAFVIQDMRGRFASQGENLPFIGCGWEKYRDGADTVAWIRKQKWCNGKVGTTGGSALGITQNLLAGASPEGLVCQYINVAAASLYHHAAYVGGALRKSQVQGWLRGNRFDPKAMALYAAHPAYDAFWHKVDSMRKLSEINVPAMHVGGWFDTFSQGTVDAFVGRQTRGAPGARGSQKLVMGPWGHGRSSFGRVGELRFPNSRMPARYSAANWFGYWLKGRKTSIKDAPAVAYYVMGDTAGGGKGAPGNEWRFADAWPIPCTQTPYYFHADGTLSADKPPPADGKPSCKEYTFDPAEPCPTVGGCNLLLPSGPRNQNRIETRHDVLTFTTAALAEPIEVTGNATAKIFVSSSAVDTDLSVRLCDVYPDGKSYLMAEGMLRLRYRASFATPQPLTPGKVCEVTVPCWATSIVFNKGHRIRLTVTSSNHPRFDVNPGTGRPWTPGCKTANQTNRIYCDGACPSRIVLPVIPPAKPKPAKASSP